jgi:hypothetical protein
MPTRTSPLASAPPSPLRYSALPWTGLHPGLVLRDRDVESARRCGSAGRRSPPGSRGSLRAVWGEYAAGVAMGYEKAVSESELPPTRVAGRGRGWYRGDCHVHSVYSDGKLTPEHLATGAREAGLDFIATTEHNTSDAHGAWGRHAGDDLLVILGEEVTTQTGHWLALGIHPGQVVDWRYRVRDQMVDRHLDQVHRAGGLCVAAHPHVPYASGVFMYPYQGFDVVEVWNPSASTPTKARCTANRCPATDQAPWSGAPARRNQRSSASRYATPKGTWRRSATRSSWPETRAVNRWSVCIPRLRYSSPHQAVLPG